jgi:hypothetical protein
MPSMIWYDTTWYESRAIGLQYNTYMYGKPAQYIRSAVRTVFPQGRYDTTQYEPRAIQYNTYGKPRTVQYDTIWHGTNRENASCKPRDFIYDPRDFLLCPEVFHDKIRGLYCISSGRNRIVLQILTTQTDHALIRTRYDLIPTYGTGCRCVKDESPCTGTSWAAPNFHWRRLTYFKTNCLEEICDRITFQTILHQVNELIWIQHQDRSNTQHSSLVTNTVNHEISMHDGIKIGKLACF